MSAQVQEGSFESDDAARGGQLALAPEPVDVRRNAGLMAVVGGGAAAIAIAYLARASATGAVWDWALAGVLALIAVFYLAAFVDSRTPLMVADSQGIRVRLGRSWQGLPWASLRSVEHTPRRSVFRDGRLVVVPHTEERLLAELDRRGRRQARWSQRLHGAPLAFPLGLATRASTPDEDLVTALQALAGAGVNVVRLTPETSPETSPEPSPESGIDEPTVEPEVIDPSLEPETEGSKLRWTDPRPLVAAGISWTAGLLRRESTEKLQDEDEGLSAEPQAEVEVEVSPTPEPTRLFRLARRSEVTVDAPEHDEDEAPRPRAVSRPGRVDLVEDEDTQVLDLRVRPIAREGHAVAPLEIDDYDAEPAEDPVIGPELAAARTRLGLSVDQLADRTRIRPHVIESLEVDDFAPCGGDFYARGHLRTLARVLGVPVAPLLEAYDARYAHAPISPRRVFEAELAAGTHGGIRGTRGGPNWSVLVAAVMAVVLAWSVARLVMDGPEEFRQVPSLSDGSGGVAGTQGARTKTVPVLLRAASGGAHVVVRDGNGKTVFTGDLSFGATRALEVAPPVRVESTDGGVEVVADGVEQGQLGETGQPATGTFIGR